MTSHTAGIIIIGDEILKGQIIDTNSQFLCKRLHSLGIKVCKISVVSDDVDEIAAEVADFSQKYDKVITSGGVGPTHDDVTYVGVARAFRQNVQVNKEFASWFLNVDIINDINDIEANPALKLAQIPQSSTLLIPVKKSHQSNTFSVPIVKINNVYVFPGIPQYFEHMVNNLEHLLVNPSGDKFYNRELYINKGELEIISILNSAVEKFKNSVVFGSYPEVGKETYLTKITLESKTSDCVDEAEKYLQENLPPGSVVAPMAEVIYGMLKEVPKKGLSSSVSTAVKVLEKCFEKYHPSEVFVSFNGGKDCTALLHLTAAVLNKKFPAHHAPLQALYIRKEDPFPEVEEFVNESVVRYSFILYNLNLKTICGPIKHGLGVLLKENPHLKAGLMGTRRTDPYSETLKSFQMTDESWPQVMRVCPILDWSYQDVWKFLRDLSVPYCKLYDEGYTSLDGLNNTEPNPALSYVDANGVVHYSPAYTLKDGATERNGRL
ncbi:hypothetical protein L9F63_004092 [Diploptera punctata]|uniref:FAD synthase n=1 Tax=Diploptera punctata TaxID=6984 RepID=A0AAD7ZGG5_DIPPU|nr:hypothetical protein L9F63_004092 [Diploptera punctata]